MVQEIRGGLRSASASACVVLERQPSGGRSVPAAALAYEIDTPLAKRPLPSASKAVSPPRSARLSLPREPHSAPALPSRDELRCVLQQAHLAQDVYDKSVFIPAGSKGVPGWQNISEDPQKLKRYGLTPEDLQQASSSGFRVRLYAPTASMPGGTMAAQLVFRGTEPEPVHGRHDWTTNLLHQMGVPGDHYRRARDLGRLVAHADADVELVGHSLGGSLASAAALTSGKRATLFNSAGLHPEVRRSLSDDGEPLHNGVEIHGYHVAKEWLTSLQRNTWAPEALGTSVSLKGPNGCLMGNRVARHIVPAVAYGLAHAIKEMDRAGSQRPMHRVRTHSVPPFGYFSKTAQQLTALLVALDQTPSLRAHLRDSLMVQQQFLRDCVVSLKEGRPPPQDTAARIELAKDLATELPHGWTQEAKQQRLMQLLQGAERVLARLPLRSSL